MKNTLGTNVTVTLFGESHGDSIGAVIDGLAAGIRVDENFIRAQLTLRRPAGKISTARQETDPFKIVSGVFEGKTAIIKGFLSKAGKKFDARLVLDAESKKVNFSFDK